MGQRGPFLELRLRLWLRLGFGLGLGLHPRPGSTHVLAASTLTHTAPQRERREDVQEVDAVGS